MHIAHNILKHYGHGSGINRITFMTGRGGGGK